MTRPSFLLGCMAPVILVAAIARAEEEKKPRFQEMCVVRSEGVIAWTAQMEERILAMAIARDRDGSGTLAILAAPPKRRTAKPDTQANEPCKPGAGPREQSPPTASPRRLLLFRPSGEGELRVARDDLPADARDLAAADLDADGGDELLLARGNRISILEEGGNGAWVDGKDALQESAGLERFVRGARSGRGGSVPLVWFQAVGFLRGYGPEPGGNWTLRAEVPLPVKVEKEESAFALSSPQVMAVDPGAGVPFLATRPESWKGADRIRTVVVTVDPKPTWGECWCRLPQPERVIDSKVLRFDGRPFLAVTTIPADKLSIFGEKLLRLCPLEADRTRSGKSPLLSVESRINLWQEAEPFAADVNGDGREDLVVGYWKGLKDNTVVLDTYLRRADGSFEPSPKTTSFDVEDADRDSVGYGDDIDGDGLTDLLVRAGGGISFHPGLPGSSGKRIVAPRARWTVSLATTPGAGEEKVELQIRIGSGGMDASATGPGAGTIQLLDVDRDGRKEILVQQPTVDGISRLSVIRATRESGTSSAGENLPGKQ